MSVRQSSDIKPELDAKRQQLFSLQKQVDDLEAEFTTAIEIEQTAGTPRQKMTAEDFNRERDGNFKSPFGFSRK